MQGGLKLSLLQDWTEEASKRVIIITDAPPHGTKYHNEGIDDFPKGSPDGIVLEDLMKEFAQKEIEFQVIQLNKSTTKMIAAMKSVYQCVDVIDMSEDMKEEQRLKRESRPGDFESMRKCESRKIESTGKFMMKCSEGMVTQV